MADWVDDLFGPTPDDDGGAGREPASFGPVPADGSEGSAYGLAALAAETAAVASTAAGGRNDRLNVAAYSCGQLVGSGHLREDVMLAALRAAARASGLDPVEIEKTLRSGLRAGLREPRDVPALPERSYGTLTVVEGGLEAVDGFLEPVLPSWVRQAITVAVAAEEAAPEPTHLRRVDGAALLYAGKINGLIGESESGKSWLALVAVVQAVAEGQRALILDFEDSAGSVRSRLTALGLAGDLAAGIDYANPSEPLAGQAGAAWMVETVAAGYGVLVVDGVNAAMDVLGFDPLSNVDATRFARLFLRPLASSGACLVMIDHVAKNPENRRGAIGAQAKRAMVDGTLILVEAVEPFGRGLSGCLKLTVNKDRNGRVRGISAAGGDPGRARVESLAGGDLVTIAIEVPEARQAGGRATWRPTAIMEKVSDALELLGPGVSFRGIKDAVYGREATIKAATETLVAEGFVLVSAGPRKSVLHSLTRPYRQVDDPDSDAFSGVSPTVSHRLPETVTVSTRRPSPSVSVSPPMGDTGDGRRETVEEPVMINFDGDRLPVCNDCGRPTPWPELERYDGRCRDCGSESYR